MGLETVIDDAERDPAPARERAEDALQRVRAIAMGDEDPDADAFFLLGVLVWNDRFNSTFAQIPSDTLHIVSSIGNQMLGTSSWTSTVSFYTDGLKKLLNLG